MECHRCDHREALEAGKYARMPFEKTPCAKCELREVSLRTMEVDPERPVYVVGGEVGAEPTCNMVPFPEEAEAEVAEAKLPVDVLEELVTRLLTLPQELRDVVCWRFMGMEYQDIASKQRITTAGAEARHRRAMRMFPELRELFILKTTRMKLRQPAGTVVACGV
ncbi:MAG: hypothetical protein WCS01_15450 [bacterium]